MSMNDNIASDEAYVSRAEAARLLGLSAPQVSRLLKSGVLQGLAPVDWRISIASIEACKASPRPRGWKKGRARKPITEQA